MVMRYNNELKFTQLHASHTGRRRKLIISSYYYKSTMISHIFLSGFILLYLTTTTAVKAAPRFSSQTVMSDKQSQHVPKNDVLQPFNVRRHLRGQQQQQVQKQAQQVL